jgi:hypothetical protein
MGGDLRHLDAATLALLTNREVLAVNQASTDNQPHFIEDGMRVWTARPVSGAGRYLALFNTADKPREVGVDLRWLGGPASVRVHDLWAGADLGTIRDRVAQRIGPHGAGLYRLS